MKSISDHHNFEGTVIAENECWQLRVEVNHLTPSNLNQLRFISEDTQVGTSYQEYFLTNDALQRLKDLL